jgi:hypothetical protein
MAMAPALTDADVSGTWTGTVMPEGSDSAVVHWTQTCAAGSCSLTTQESKDTVMSTYTIDADSVIGTSSQFSDPQFASAPIIDKWVSRLASGRVTGTGMMVLASQPDSVVFRYRFEGTRMP